MGQILLGGVDRGRPRHGGGRVIHQHAALLGADKDANAGHIGIIAAVAAVVATADAYAQSVANHIKAARFDGIVTLAGCADYLNRHQVKTRRGFEVTPMTVKRLAERLGITFP